MDVFRGPPSALPRWATVRQGGLGRGRREEEERWEESFYSLTYLPKMDGSIALAIFIFQGHRCLPTLECQSTTIVYFSIVSTASQDMIIVIFDLI